MLFLVGVVQFCVCGGFANTRESRTYDSVYYLRREKTTKNTLNITFFWENVLVPLYGCMLSFNGNTTLGVFSKQRTNNSSKRHDSITGTITWPITVPVSTYPGVLAKIFCSNLDTYKVRTYIISD